MQSVEGLPQRTNRKLNWREIIILICLAFVATVIIFILTDYKSPGTEDPRFFEIGESRLQEIDSLFLQKRTDEVIEKSQEFLEEYPDSGWTPIILMFIGRSYQEVGRLQEASVIFQELADDYPDYKDIPTVIYELGVINLDLGNEEKADEYFNLILREYPDTQGWHLVESGYYEIQPLFVAEKYREAIDKAYEVLGKNPGDEFIGSILFMIGECYYKLNDYDNALLLFREVEDEYPNDFYAPRAVYDAGIVYSELGEDKKAEEYFAKLLEEYPNAPQSMTDDAQRRLEASNNVPLN